VQSEHADRWNFPNPSDTVRITGIRFDGGESGSRCDETGEPTQTPTASTCPPVELALHRLRVSDTGAKHLLLEDVASEYYWGGLASTAFWVDRVTAMFFAQLIPSNTYPLRQQLSQLVNSALVD
jgi:hypothetical protein